MTQQHSPFIDTNISLCPSSSSAFAHSSLPISVKYICHRGLKSVQVEIVYIKEMARVCIFVVLFLSVCTLGSSETIGSQLYKGMHEKLFIYLSNGTSHYHFMVEGQMPLLFASQGRIVYFLRAMQLIYPAKNIKNRWKTGRFFNDTWLEIMRTHINGQIVRRKIMNFVGYVKYMHLEKMTQKWLTYGNNITSV